MYVYQIQSLNNHKKYIGITNDYNRRMREHKTYHNPESLIDQAIQLDGESSFSFSIIEECDSYETAFEKEKYYISKFNTKFPNGYNLTSGGEAMIGEDNGRAKFSTEEIAEIRDRFNSDENYLEIYQDFKRVSLGQFLKILRNETYLNCPIKCKKRSLYNQGYITKLKNNSLKFTREEIEYFRKCWLDGINYKVIYEDYKDICSKDYFYQVYYGLIYKDIMPEVFTEERKHFHSSQSHSGENNGKSKLNAAIVKEMRNRYANEKITYSELAKEYGVTPTTIRMAITKQTWKNI